MNATNQQIKDVKTCIDNILSSFDGTKSQINFDEIIGGLHLHGEFIVDFSESTDGDGWNNPFTSEITITAMEMNQEVDFGLYLGVNGDYILSRDQKTELLNYIQIR